MTSVLTKKQVKKFGPKSYTDSNGYHHSITATVRYDDDCGNGHNTFAITGDDHSPRGGSSGGMLHDLIAEHFPELKPYLKWHLVSSDGPMHYVANTIYFAGDKDHNGLAKGEVKQLINGKTKQLAWKLADGGVGHRYIDADEQPEGYVPWTRTGEGKARELDYARSSAVWPEATDEDLTAPGLKERLEARLPALMIEFKAAVESLGLVY